jgi:hypothetical protein
MVCNNSAMDNLISNSHVCKSDRAGNDQTFSSARTMSTCWMGPLSVRPRKSHLLMTQIQTVTFTSCRFSSLSGVNSIAFYLEKKVPEERKSQCML